MKWAGIDYGSKVAGTTVIAYSANQQILLLASRKKQDADQMILDWAGASKPDYIFIDAPLSLPGVYQKPQQYDDYFYRKADRDLSAMSPMFLGGLTARAMKLKAQLEKSGIKVHEVYPGGLAKKLPLDPALYKKDKSYIGEATEVILQQLDGYQMQQIPSNWHQLDALLALASGHRFIRGVAQLTGTEEEGQIIL
jgi:predicted nuclease with RNAse H fold